jgi:DNA-binding transcriptional MerR regulator
MEKSLPAIPAKRYFTIGEVGELCGVKPHVLRYWEQEFTQLRPMKRRGNRRYYQHHEVLMIRRIRELLYDQGFTINGARAKLQELAQHERDRQHAGEVMLTGVDDFDTSELEPDELAAVTAAVGDGDKSASGQFQLVMRELREIRDLLNVPQWYDLRTL